MSILASLGERHRRNPYPLYSMLRTIRPVLHDAVHGVWLLFDYESVKRALQDHASFSSAAIPPGGKGALDWLIFHDDPRHAQLRGIVAKAFTPRSIAALEPRIVELTRELLTRYAQAGSMDLVTDFAETIPTLVIAEMIGIPASDRATFTRWAHAILNLGYTVTGGERAARAGAEYRVVSAEMKEYLTAALADRRMHRRDDLLTRMVEAEVDGARLTDHETVGFVQLLLSAGTETTTNTLSNAVIALLDHPAQLADLRARPELWPQAIEEVIRHRSPVQTVFRMTRSETVVRGRRIPAGALVLPMIGSANHDSRCIANADTFDIHRSNNPHIAFGHGIHFCIGAALARLELRVMLPMLFDTLPGLRRADRRGWQPRDAPLVHGPKRLSVEWEVRAVNAASSDVG